VVGPRSVGGSRFSGSWFIGDAASLGWPAFAFLGPWAGFLIRFWCPETGLLVVVCLRAAGNEFGVWRERNFGAVKNWIVFRAEMHVDFVGFTRFRDF